MLVIRPFRANDFMRSSHVKCVPTACPAPPASWRQVARTVLPQLSEQFTWQRERSTQTWRGEPRRQDAHQESLHGDLNALLQSPALTVNMRLCNPVVRGPSEQHTQQTHVPAVRRRKEQQCEGVRRARSCARREWQPARDLHGTASLKLRKTISSH